jgi:hypothetical protein
MSADFQAGPLKFGEVDIYVETVFDGMVALNVHLKGASVSAYATKDQVEALELALWRAREAIADDERTQAMLDSDARAAA